MVYLSDIPYVTSQAVRRVNIPSSLNVAYRVTIVNIYADVFIRVSFESDLFTLCLLERVLLISVLLLKNIFLLATCVTSVAHSD